MSTARCSRARVPCIRLPLTLARVSRMLIHGGEIGLELGQLNRIQRDWIPWCLNDRLYSALGYRRQAYMNLAAATGLAPTALRPLRNRV